MACSDYKTECLRVVNIAYLKEFIGNNVQNSSDGSTKYVDSSEDRYCPTYGELTGGTYIQTWSQGTNPRGDRDGIVVSQTWAGDGSRYADNQLVDQRDLSLRYTRLNELSIERTSPNDIMSACSGTTGLRYTYNYKRYIKSMNANNCAISTSNSTVNDACSALTYTTTFQGLSNSGSSVTNCTTYKVYKNGDFSSENRDDTVYATARFRGTPYTSNSVIIKQAGLSGSYSKEISTREVTTKVTASAASQTSFDCNGGEYSARGTRHYKIVAKRAYVDICGKEYSQTKEFDKVTGLTQNLESGGTFGYYDCCKSGHSETKSITFVRDGLSSQTITFTQSCPNCSSDPGCNPPPACEGVEYTIYPDKLISCSGGNVTFSFEGGCSCSLLDISTTSMSFAETGETKTARFTLAAACGLDWTKPSWITVSESRDDDGTGTLSCTASENDSGSGRTGTVTLKVNNSSCHTISVSQDGEAPPEYKDISTAVNKGSVTPSGTTAEEITFTAGGTDYTIEDANLNFDVAAESATYPTAMFGKEITAVSVKTDVEGETIAATVSPTTITDSTSTVTITLKPTGCFLQGPDTINMRGEESGHVGFVSLCGRDYGTVEVLDQGALDSVTITQGTASTQGAIDFKYSGSADTYIKIGQTEGDAPDWTMIIYKN